MLLNVIDTGCIVHKTIDKGVFIAHAVLGDKDLLVVGVLQANADQEVKEALRIDDPVPIRGGNAGLVYALAHARQAEAVRSLFARAVVVKIVFAFVGAQEAAW